MRIGIIGAGATGARAARQMLGFEDVDRVVVVDARTDRCDGVVASLGDRAEAHRGADRMPPGCDAVILAVPASEHGPLAADALRSGAHVVSVSDSIDDTRALLDLDHEARERGRNVVVGAGFSPGLSDVLADLATAGLDDIGEIHIARVGTGGPSCARQHHRALGGWAVDWRDGGWTRRRGGSGRELCWFPDPIGGNDCYRAALPDALLLVPAFTGVQRVTARMGATRRDRFTARLPMMRRPHPEGGPGGLRVEVRGRVDGEQVVRVLGAMDRPSVAAGAVAALAAHGAVHGTMRDVGASGLAGLVEPRRFLSTLRDRGVRAAVFEGADAPVTPTPAK